MCRFGTTSRDSDFIAYLNRLTMFRKDMAHG